MKISLASSSGWRLREAPFPFQLTYVTPVQELERFVCALLAPFELSHATVRIETIVFKPEELIDRLNTAGIDTDEGELNRATLTAEDASEAREVLQQFLGQWIDFVFLPDSGQFAIYADHDEYTTIFTATEELLSSLRGEMSKHSFSPVHDWKWTGPHSPGKLEKGIHV